MSRQKILVTGGAGYIGAHMCRLLHLQGFLPVTFDNLTTGKSENVIYGPLFVGDIRNESSLEGVFKEHDLIAIIHFAASAYVSESVTDPLKYFDNNIVGSTNLVKLAIKHNVLDFVFSSSCAVYGESSGQLISEDAPLVPINPYGYSKLAIEKLLEYSAGAYGLRYSILRYFNVAGENPEVAHNESHKPETHVIPLLFKAAKMNQIFEIFGNDYPTKDGTAIRDYVHVSDLVNGHLLALLQLLEVKKSSIYNLGSGMGTSILDLVFELGNQVNPLKYEFLPRRTGDPAILIANSDKAKAELFWRPSQSNSREIIESLILWEARHLH